MELPADFRAFHELYRGAYVYWADAEEAVDAALEQLFFAWADVLKKRNPTAYTWRVVRFRTIDLARARGRRAVVVDTAVFETESLRQASDPIEELEMSLEIYQAVRTLPDRQHDVFILRDVLATEPPRPRTSWACPRPASARPAATPGTGSKSSSRRSWRRKRRRRLIVRTEPIDRVLARARIERPPYTGVEKGKARLSARIAGRMWQKALSFDDLTQSALAITDRAALRCSLPYRAFHRHLRILCEMIVTHDLTKLAQFLSSRIPEPDGAMVLGCVLQLAGREDSARFWWQFAAGAGDQKAACCLYLHHTALGELREAELWHRYSGLEDHIPLRHQGPDRNDLHTVLRVLDGLRDTNTPCISPAVTAVIAYVPHAIGYVDSDVELPSPPPTSPNASKNSPHSPHPPAGLRPSRPGPGGGEGRYRLCGGGRR